MSDTITPLASAVYVTPTATATATPTVTVTRSSTPTPTVTKTPTKSVPVPSSTRTPTPTRRPATPVAPFLSVVRVLNNGTPHAAQNAVLQVGITKPVNYSSDNSPITYVVTVKNAKSNSVKTYTFIGTGPTSGFDISNLPAVSLAASTCKTLVFNICYDWIFGVPQHIENLYQVSVKAVAYGIQSAASNVVTIGVQS
jgi:hypothetical protein